MCVCQSAEPEIYRESARPTNDSSKLLPLCPVFDVKVQLSNRHEDKYQRNECCYDGRKPHQTVMADVLYSWGELLPVDIAGYLRIVSTLLNTLEVSTYMELTENGRWQQCHYMIN